MQPGQFLSVPEHTGLILCSDGVRLFKSCGQSMWPIEMAVTSLPPKIRMNANNLLLDGVWLGPVKPDMKVILKPIRDKIEELNLHGVTVKTQNGTKQVRACLLLGVFDLPAKAIATNMTQYNGRFSCTYCLDKGEHISHCPVFLPEYAHQPRTTQSVEQCAAQALECGQPIKGVKGESVLSTHINIVDAVPVDYMHAIFEGVVKKLVEFWTDTKHHSKRYYLGRNIDEINKRLKCIKPPHEFRRTPRPITTYSYWKASEFRAWLLYYSIPILSDLLPSDYVYHLSLLVAAMHLLLSDCILVSEIQTADELLNLFYTITPKLYPLTMCSSNMHTLVHMCKFVHVWGPLWCYSTFGFENLKGHLRRHCHGTRNVLPQLVHTIRMRQMLPAMSNRLMEFENPATVAYLKTFNYASTKDAETNVEKSAVVGRVKKLMNDRAQKALVETGFAEVPVPLLPVFTRLHHNSVLYSCQTKAEAARNSGVCAFEHNSGMQFGSAITFCCAQGQSVAIFDVFEQIGEGPLHSLRHPTLQKLCEKTTVLNDFVFKVKKLSSPMTVAVPTSSIVAKCVHIPLKHFSFDFIVTIPNMFEHH